MLLHPLDGGMGGLTVAKTLKYIKLVVGGLKPKQSVMNNNFSNTPKIVVLNITIYNGYFFFFCNLVFFFLVF